MRIDRQVFRRYRRGVSGHRAPHAFAWVLGKAYGVSILSVMLGIIMFGMGMTTSLHDFALVLKQPKNIFFGVCA